ncbi:MAG: hypothetical protein BWY91_02545 [bacterium ADurb.BinA028]|nr:MAG: hypothetical protein BWY91_02545 [bacterium ADurb.BinA028]
MTSGFDAFTLLSDALTSVAPLGKYWVSSTVNPRSLAALAAPSAARLEKPSSAERTTTEVGLGLASSATALTIDAAYSVAGESTPKVRL